jgi:hypothetical protein
MQLVYRRRLLGRKPVARWFGGPHSTPTSGREHWLYTRLKALSPEAAYELDDICGARIVEGEERTLFVAGTLLMQAGQRRLWRQVYRACLGGLKYTKDDEIKFLQRMTTAAKLHDL